jgi:hypothetical protein
VPFWTTVSPGPSSTARRRRARARAARDDVLEVDGVGGVHAGRVGLELPGETGQLGLELGQQGRGIGEGGACDGVGRHREHAEAEAADGREVARRRTGRAVVGKPRHRVRAPQAMEFAAERADRDAVDLRVAGDDSQPWGECPATARTFMVGFSGSRHATVAPAASSGRVRADGVTTEQCEAERGTPPARPGPTALSRERRRHDEPVSRQLDSVSDLLRHARNTRSDLRHRPKPADSVAAESGRSFTRTLGRLWLH